MRLASRLRASHVASAAGLFSATLLLAPPPASADRDDWEDGDRHRRHHHRRHHDHDDHCRHKKHHRHHHGHGDWYGPRYARPYYDAPVYYGPPPRAHRARYYCEPCSHWYDDEPAFHYHVRHHHHVPREVLPLVILATVFGAVFGGY